jgi:molybdopterin-containing oxidoreductase family membrane subunit
MVSIPWAVSIHTVTAFLYCGLPGRSSWLTAIMTPRFLSSAFASGPALLVLLCLALRKMKCVEVGREAVDKLATIVSYAMLLNVFFVMLEVFTAFYSRIPAEVEPFRDLFVTSDGNAPLVTSMWIAAVLAVVSLALLLARGTSDARLGLACAGVFVSLWLDKGLVMIVGGFVPSPLGAITEYSPTAPEAAIAAGIWAAVALLATILFRLAISVRSLEVSHEPYCD